MSKFKAVENRVYRDGVFFLFCDDEEDAQDLAEAFNQEIATKDAVIEAQSQRIKELEGVLKQIALNAPKSSDEIENPIHHNTVKNHALNFVYAGLIAGIAIKPLAESEADNG